MAGMITGFYGVDRTDGGTDWWHVNVRTNEAWKFDNDGWTLIEDSKQRCRDLIGGFRILGCDVPIADTSQGRKSMGYKAGEYDAFVSETFGSVPSTLDSGLGKPEVALGWEVKRTGRVPRLEWCCDGFEPGDFNADADFDDDIEINAEPEVVEPEPDTVEMPVVDSVPEPKPSKVVKVSSTVIPLGVGAKASGLFDGFAHRPRCFRSSTGRKAVYVGFDEKRCVVAWREGVEREKSLVAEVREYVGKFGFELEA